LTAAAIALVVIEIVNLRPWVATAAYSVVIDTAVAKTEAVAEKRLQKGGCEDMAEVKGNPLDLPHENR
jgi:hypothetical protein